LKNYRYRDLKNGLQNSKIDLISNNSKSFTVKRKKWKERLKQMPLELTLMESMQS